MGPRGEASRPAASIVECPRPVSDNHQTAAAWSNSCSSRPCSTGKRPHRGWIRLRRRSRRQQGCLQPAGCQRLDASSVCPFALYHALDDGQPHPRSLLVALQPLEYPGNILEVPRLDTNAIVAHVYDMFRLSGLGVQRLRAPNLNLSGRTRPGRWLCGEPCAPLRQLLLFVRLTRRMHDGHYHNCCRRHRGQTRAILDFDVVLGGHPRFLQPGAIPSRPRSVSFRFHQRSSQPCRPGHFKARVGASGSLSKTV